MTRIGITGTIGSGKTSASIILKRRGYRVFDSDGYVKHLYHKNHPLYKQLIEDFTDIYDYNMEVDFKKLSKLIFNDKAAKKKLEDLIHPYVLEGMQKMFDNNQGLVFAEVPLLFEVGWEKHFDKTILITCDRDIAIERLVRDRGYSLLEANKRMDNQFDASIKIERADFVVYNNTTIKDLEKNIIKIVGEIKTNDPK